MRFVSLVFAIFFFGSGCPANAAVVTYELDSTATFLRVTGNYVLGDTNYPLMEQIPGSSVLRMSGTVTLDRNFSDTGFARLTGTLTAAVSYLVEPSLDGPAPGSLGVFADLGIAGTKSLAVRSTEFGLVSRPFLLVDADDGLMGELDFDFHLLNNTVDIGSNEAYGSFPARELDARIQTTLFVDTSNPLQEEIHWEIAELGNLAADFLPFYELQFTGRSAVVPEIPSLGLVVAAGLFVGAFQLGRKHRMALGSQRLASEPHESSA